MRITTIGENNAVRIETAKGLPNWIKVVFHTHSHVSSNDNLQTEVLKKNINNVLQYPLGAR